MGLNRDGVTHNSPISTINDALRFKTRVRFFVLMYFREGFLNVTGFLSRERYICQKLLL
ncbi:hypothetical protein [Mucilaginibacter sp. 22184]|uniref:hypothetical protein n=1 Tax=Mucilaginibacter sp. 22184 TaxID=3453887 RepID=UPI003F84FD5F|nr:hypothetical protein [Mucilaginibacter sp. SG564]